MRGKATEKTTARKVRRARKAEETPALATDWLRVQPAHDVIAVRAYERFCARGHQHGHDVEDWLAAERELSH